MQFNPETKALYTDEGELVKVLHCPLRKQWDQLALLPVKPHRTCANCERMVLDTAAMTDAEVLSAVRADPSTCLAVSSRQANVTILHRGLRESTSTRMSLPDTTPDAPKQV
jgi:hypothetical protein